MISSLEVSTMLFNIFQSIRGAPQNNWPCYRPAVLSGDHSTPTGVNKHDSDHNKQRYSLLAVVESPSTSPPPRPNTASYSRVPNIVFLGYIIYDFLYRCFPNTDIFSPVMPAGVLGWTALLFLKLRYFWESKSKVNEVWKGWFTEVIIINVPTLLRRRTLLSFNI